MGWRRSGVVEPSDRDAPRKNRSSTPTNRSRTVPTTQIEPTAQQLETLAVAARDVCANAYCPASNYPVGAAVLTSDGRIFAGCNVENASYGLTICAERNAIFHAKASTRCNLEILAVAIYTPTDQVAAPCGACRQVINEFGPHARITSRCKGNNTLDTTLNRLLPRAFGPRDLVGR